MTKILNQIIFFFLHQNQNIFFSNIGNQNNFLEKNHNPLPLQVKWSVPNPTTGSNVLWEFAAKACQRNWSVIFLIVFKGHFFIYWCTMYHVLVSNHWIYI
jgi:hypothetical protein